MVVAERFGERLRGKQPGRMSEPRPEQRFFYRAYNAAINNPPEFGEPSVFPAFSFGKIQALHFGSVSGTM
jgi:hypothetical protein